MTCDSREFFKLFFRELEARGVPYVILHSYRDYPEKFSSDIDFAVPDQHLAALGKIQAELARKNGWALVQNLHANVFARYAVLVNLANPAEHLKLDACSSYARARNYYIPEKILLTGRVRFHDFYIPAPAAEFIYVLAKVFDAKHKDPADYFPPLKELWLQDPDTAQKYFNDLFGDTGKTLAQWFATPAEEWRQLGPIMSARNGFGPGLMLREVARMVKRVCQPTGICLGVLGSDGSGKSTLLTKLQALFEPCFRQQKTLHFRPQILRKRTKDGAEDIANPHGRPPRNAVSSCFRVIYYFADHWAGWFLIVLPARIRSTAVIFDRDFDDMLVDQRRYRLNGAGAAIRILRALLPQPQRVFILSAPAAVLHARKPELPVPELERQQQVLRQLAGEGRRYVLVSAEQPPDRVAETVWREVALMLAAREEKRAGLGT